MKELQESTYRQLPKQKTTHLRKSTYIKIKYFTEHKTKIIGPLSPRFLK